MTAGEFWCLSGIVLIAFAVRIYGIKWGLPYEYHPDEPTILRIAMRLGTGDLNPHWHVYPAFSYYVLFTAEAFYSLYGLFTGLFTSIDDIAVSFFSDPTNFYIVGRGLQAVIGCVTVILVYLIGSRIYSVRTGLVSAFFTALSYSQVITSHIIRPSNLALLLTVTAFYFIVNIYQRGDRKDYILAGIFSGLAMATRLEMGAIAIPFLAAHISRRYSNNTVTLRSAVFNKLLIIYGATVMLSFFVGSPYSIIDIKSVLSYMSGFHAQARLGWLGIEGVTNAYVRVLSDFLAKDLGIALLVLSAVGAICGFYKNARLTILVLAFPLFYYLFMGRYPYQMDHRWMIMSPFLLILASNVLVMGIGNLNVTGQAKAALLPLLVILFAISPLSRIIAHDYHLSQKDTRTIAKEWIESNIPGGSQIALEQYSPPLIPDRESFLSIIEGTGTGHPGKKDWDKSWKHIISTTEKNAYSRTQGKYIILAYEKQSSESVQYKIKKVPTIGLYPVSYYRENGFQYLVMSSYMRGRYTGKEAYYPITVNNYNSIIDRFKLIKRVSPDKKHAGPVIDIMKVIH